MTVAVANTSNTHTFQYWINRTNELAYAMTYRAVTTESNTASGNAAITGTFTANVFSGNSAVFNYITVNTSISAIGIISNTLVVNSTANIFSINANTILANTSIRTPTLIIANATADVSVVPPTSAQQSNGFFYLNANGAWSLAGIPLPASNGSTTTSGTSTQTIDFFSKTNFGADYFIQVIDNAANNYMTTKVIVAHDGSTNPNITEFATILSNSNMGTFSANANSTHVSLIFTPVSGSTTVKFFRVVL